ncbi:MAG: hypothetical protein KKF89_03110 [Nanoarchaeota archaeon]|nr:hypothetical protein [Nanoarchaeota archaeon]MBU1854684.1 hypothetical protein [Nanoarchaeota archaeon]
MFKVAPLPSSFMLFSMFGFIASAFLLTSVIKTWAFAFLLVFVAMFIASIISMSKAPLEEEYLEKLAIHNQHHYKRKKK